MGSIFRMLSTVGFSMALAGCSAPSQLTVTVEEGDNYVVRLQVVPEADEGRGFSHPATIAPETIEQILKGLIVEEPVSLVPLALGGGSSVQRTAAFGDTEAGFLAPILAKGLTTATPEEVVTFYETADISSTQRVVTSGGVFVRGDFLHVVLGNHLTKVDTWQDNEQYEAPYRLRPMEPIHPKPGHLAFEPAHLMASPGGPTWFGALRGDPRLHVAVKYRELR